jgi:ribonuclease D
MIVEILKEQKFIFIDAFSEVRASYKGYVSWLLIGTHSRLYLIDAARLHDECYKLKEVLERKELIKFMHECQEVVFALKRDWEMFLPNIFDIEVVQRYWAKKGKTSHSRSALKEFLASPQNPINNRPMKQNIISKFQEYYDS